MALTRGAAVAGGIASTASLVSVLVGEVVHGEDFTATTGAVAAGWASLLGAVLLVVGVGGVAVRFGRQLSRTGGTAVVVLLVSAAFTVAAASTLALVVPTLADRLPEMMESPPAVIPATFILSGLVMAASGVVLALSLGRDGVALPRRATNLLIAGSVVAAVPLPSRYFLLCFAVAAVLGNRTVRRMTGSGGDRELLAR